MVKPLANSHSQPGTLAMQMNSFTGKQILSMVRESDYAHAGEEEAIELVLRNEPRDANRLILDVGCGRGGTAKYVSDHGWGTVVGLDREPDSIARAKQVYPGIEFHACDVLEAETVVRGPFDLLYHFNSFYAFGDQRRALAVLSRLAKDTGRLVIFDYTDRGGYAENPLIFNGSPFLPHPVKLAGIGDVLRETGWQLERIDDLTAEYDRWYESLLNRVDGKREAIVGLAGEAAFASVREQYVGLLTALRDGRLGGAIIVAKRRVG
jgi:SAM-dependent methyltransferase